MIKRAAALHRGEYAGRNADRNGEQHRRHRQFDGGRKQREELFQHLLVGDNRGTEVASHEMTDVVEELLPHRLIETKLVTKLRQSLGFYAALSGADFYRIARYQPDRNERDEHQREECRQRQRKAAGEEIGRASCRERGWSW